MHQSRILNKIIEFVVLTLVVLICSSLARATTVTGTLVDPSSQPLINSTVTAEFVPLPGTTGSPVIPPVTFTTDSNGGFTTTLTDNRTINPSGSTYKFTICPNATVNCFIAPGIVITGATQDISTALNSQISNLSVNAQTLIPKAYNDTQVPTTGLGNVGAIYWNTLARTLKLWDGSVWSSPLLNTTGNDLRNGLNVTCNGATNDTTGIQSYINSLSNNSVAIISSGCIDSSLTINNSIFNIRGIGQGKSQFIQPAGSTGIGININPTGSAGNFKEYLTFADFDLLGVTGSSHGMSMTWVTAPTLHRMRIRSFSGDGLRTFQVPRLGCYDSEFRGNGGNGASLGQQNDVSLFANCSFTLNTGWGANINYTGLVGDRSNSNTFIAPTFSSNTSGGLYVRGASTNGTSIIGGYFEANTGPDLRIGETGVNPLGVTARGVYFHGSTNATAVDIYSGTYIELSNNFFEGYSGTVINQRADVSMDFNGNSWSTAVPVITLSDGTVAPSPGNGGWARFIGPTSTDYTLSLPTNLNDMKRYYIKVGGVWIIPQKVRSDGGTTYGTATPSSTAKALNIAYNDTSGLLMKFEQQGNGLAATPVAQGTCGSASTFLGDCLDLQNKSTTTTASILRVRNGSGTIFEAKVTGFKNDTLGWKSYRVVGCATAAAVGATCDTTITYTTSFADTNYTSICNGEGITSGVPVNGGVVTKAVGSLVFRTVAMTAAVAQYGNIDCMAWHDSP